MLSKTKNIHFIGIGGIGMSGIAELLHSLNFKISGSDLIDSDRTNYLLKLGIDIKIGHSSNNITNPDLVVYSSAVNLDNIEIIESKNKEHQLHSKLALFGSAILGLMYAVSNNINNYNLFISSMFLFTIVTFYFIKDRPLEDKMLYILTFCTIVIVSIGYVIVSLLVIGLYYFLINNQMFMNDEEEYRNIDDSEDKSE